MVTVDFQIAGLAGLLAKPCQSDGVVDAVFGHLPECCPLASADRQQAGAVNMNYVIARQCRRAACTAANQRTDADENTQDVFTTWSDAQVFSGCLEDEFDLVLHRSRIENGFINWCVG